MTTRNGYNPTNAPAKESADDNSCADRQFAFAKDRLLRVARKSYGHLKSSDLDCLVLFASAQEHMREERLRLLNHNSAQALAIAERDALIAERDTVIARMALLSGRPLLQEAVASLREEQPNTREPIMRHVDVAAKG